MSIDRRGIGAMLSAVGGNETAVRQYTRAVGKAHPARLSR